MPLVYTLSPTAMRTLNYTTFAEVHAYALKEVRAAYEALPHHGTLRFECLTDREVQPTFQGDVEVTMVRLVLGSTKKMVKGAYTPVFAYLCKKDQVGKSFLRLGARKLRVKDMEDIDFQEPFDIIYDAYGQTERAGDKMCVVAAYYFLAAGHVPEITTCTGGFMKSFAKVCQKIYLPGLTTTFPNGTANSRDGKDQNGVSIRNGGRASGPLRETQEPDEEQANAQSVATHESLDLGVVAVNYQVGGINLNSGPLVNPGSSSSVHPAKKFPPLASSPTACEASATSLAYYSPSSNGQSFNSKPTTAGVPQPPTPHPRITNIDDLSHFIHAYKSLQTQNGTLLSRQIHLESLLDRAKHDQANHADLQEAYIGIETELNALRTKLAASISKSAAQRRDLQHALSTQMSTMRAAERTQWEMQERLEGLEIENKGLVEQLASKRGLEAIKEENEVLKNGIQDVQAENEKLKERVRDLESGVMVERQAFAEYKRKIRNLSMKP